jgi:ferric-dicitrate binding protein FerR (iron transport regulator)
MDQDKIWLYISRKITGEGNEDSDKLVDKWINSNQQNKKTYHHLEHIWNTRPIENNSFIQLFDSIKHRIFIHESRINSSRRLFYTIAKIAAVLAIILATNFLVYRLTPKVVENTVTWQEIVVPRGNRMKLILPDSTSVWLNNETKLAYPSDFNSGNRTVTLSGEAYFNVQHDPENPFIVKIGEQKIKVLGTKFSVVAYDDNSLIETSLISGSVVFYTDRKINGKNEFILEPNNSLTYNKSKNTLISRKIQPSFYEYWEKGMYVFNGESFESLAIKLKRIFNVDIVFEDNYLKNKTFTGTININDNIFILMEAIRRTSVEPIEYKYNKNKFYVKLKK